MARALRPGRSKPAHWQLVLELLSDGESHAHTELYALGVVAHSRVADLRAAGYEIEAWRETDESTREATYWYRLISEPASLAEPDRQSAADLQTAVPPTPPPNGRSGSASEESPSDGPGVENDPSPGAGPALSNDLPPPAAGEQLGLDGLEPPSRHKDALAA